MEGIQLILSEWAERTKQELIDKYKSMGLKASGAFEDGLSTETDENSTKIWTVPHTWYMVNGRNQNIKQDKESIKKWVGWAGSTFLKKWVEDKGLDISPFAVAYKIAREGIRVPNQYNDGTLISSVINDNSIERLLSEIGVFTIKDIKSEIIKTWQR